MGSKTLGWFECSHCHSLFEDIDDAWDGFQPICTACWMDGVEPVGSSQDDESVDPSYQLGSD